MQARAQTAENKGLQLTKRPEMKRFNVSGGCTSTELNIDHIITVPFNWNSFGRLNWANICSKVLWNPPELFRLCFTMKLLPVTRKCDLCGGDCTMCYRRKPKLQLLFVCNNCSKTANRFKVSVLTGTFFQKSRLPLHSIFAMAYWFVYGDGRVDEIIRECSPETCDLGNSTVFAYMSYFRKICCKKIYDITYIGGPSCTVEVCEFMVGKRHKTRKSLCIVIGTCRETGDIFLRQNEKNTVENFLSILIQFIQPHTKIMTDCSKFFNNLSEKEWKNITAGTNFVFTEPKYLTDLQSVRGTWAQVKRYVHQTCRDYDRLGPLLGTYMWKKKYSKMGENMYKIFLEQLAELHDGSLNALRK